MTNKKQNARQAVIKALQTRQSLGYNLWDSIDVYDAVDKLEIELRFVDIPSLDGMYIKSPYPAIFLGSHRPPGRQVFSCAHELGHHVFGHGSHINGVTTEEPLTCSSSAEEFIANLFAGFLLMPKSAVDRAFHTRGLNPNICEPHEIYTISCWFGVGYSTLLYHMHLSSNALSRERLEELKKTRPKNIRQTLLNEKTTGNLVVVDKFWLNRAIDVQVDDYVLLPQETTFEGSCARIDKMATQASIYRAITPGIGRFHCARLDWSAFLRVSRSGYVGRSIFRHLEEVEDE